MSLLRRSYASRSSGLVVFFHVSICSWSLSHGRSWDDLLLGRKSEFLCEIPQIRCQDWCNNIVQCKYYVCVYMRACWHLWKNIFFLCVRKAHSHGIIRSNNNSNICDKWQHVHKEQRMKNKAVWRPVLSCLKTDSNFSVCARRCDSQRLVFHGHFVCLCAVMSACISEAAPSQSQMKLISIKPFQIRRADGKRTAFKRPRCIPQLADQHEYLSQVS